MNKYAEYIKEHLDCSAEYGQNLLSTAQNTSNEIVKNTTEVIAESFEHGKSFLSCKSFEDVINWGEELLQKNVDNFVRKSSNIYGKACGEINKANGEVIKKFGQRVANIKNKFYEEQSS